MPIARYNKAFGGKKGSAAEAHDAIVKEYGPKKGESVFYAMVAKRGGRASVKRKKRRRRGARASAAKS